MKTKVDYESLYRLVQYTRGVIHMNLIYKKATMEDVNFLTETRIEVLKAANKLAEDVDMEEVEMQSHDYYAKGVVSFFLGHHSKENILFDIENGVVWLLEEDGYIAGTVTIKGNSVVFI